MKPPSRAIPLRWHAQVGSKYAAKDLTINSSGNVSITYNPNLVGGTHIITLVEYSGTRMVSRARVSSHEA
jgi:hypothetical protein